MTTDLGQLEREVLWFLCGMGEATPDEIRSLVSQHEPYNIITDDSAHKRKGVRFDKVLKRLEKRKLIVRVKSNSYRDWYTPYRYTHTVETPVRKDLPKQEKNQNPDELIASIAVDLTRPGEEQESKKPVAKVAATKPSPSPAHTILPDIGVGVDKKTETRGKATPAEGD
jgi:predicted transcriptional regulator